MHEVLATTMKLIKNKIELRKKLPVETIPYLIKAAENADASNKNDIENQIVKMGEDAVPYLVKELQSISGTARGIISMALIRIGAPSVEYLASSAGVNPNFKWIADYLISEIQCSNVDLASSAELQPMMAI